MSTETRTFAVGDARITSVVEEETAHIPPEFFFPAATAEVAISRQKGPSRSEGTAIEIGLVFHNTSTAKCRLFPG